MYTEDDLKTLKKALSQGALRVRLGEKETWYRSIDELKKAILTIERELKLKESPTIVQVKTSKY